MTFAALIIVCALAAVLLFFAAMRRFRRRHLLSGLFRTGAAAILLALVACALLIGGNLRSYQRLTAEQPAGELQFKRIGDREYNAVLTYPDGAVKDFALRGDEWQIDARVLKWHAFANWLGFDSIYRLERISGRYANVEDERSQLRTVYALNGAERFDSWHLVQRYHAWLPWMDALYGSATFLPMTDGALYEIKVSQSGLLARPLNQAAREAVQSWH
jgi:hypothetical protein